jgi:hypothetical protein
MVATSRVGSKAPRGVEGGPGAGGGGGEAVLFAGVT